MAEALAIPFVLLQTTPIFILSNTGISVRILLIPLMPEVPV
jgi:hypothetical protein